MTQGDADTTVESPDLDLYDSAEFLSTPAHIAAYIEAVLEDDDPALLAHAIGVAARAHGMAEIAQATGRSRESLYRALSDRGNPQLATFMGVLRALGLQLSIRPAGGKAG